MTLENQFKQKHGHAMGACCLLGRCGAEARRDAWAIVHQDTPARDDTRADALTQKHTAFNTFAELLDAMGGFYPSLNVANAEKLELADMYDEAQQLREDGRRVCRYFIPRLQQAHVLCGRN